MGRNRVVGIPLQIESVAASFTTGHSVDIYNVNTVDSGGVVTATLDPFAAHGDQVLIQDNGDNASANNISIVPSGSQSIGVALATSLVINSDGGGYLLTYQNDEGQANWAVLAQSTTTAAGGSVTSVSGNAPITSTGGATPHIGITAATDGAAGSMSAADKTKLDGIAAGAAVSVVTGTAPIVSSGGDTPAISITPATDGAAGSMSAADKTKLDALPAGGFAPRQTTTAGPGFSVPIFAAFAGSPTAMLATGSSLVTMSGSVSPSVGDLVHFGGGTPIPPLEIASIVDATHFHLTTNWGGGNVSGQATVTIPIADAMMTPADLTGLPTTGWRVNVQGVAAFFNTNVSTRNVVIYLAGADQYGNTDIFEVDLGASGAGLLGNLPVPFNLDLVANPSPATFQSRVWAYATNGSTGDVTSATSGNSFASATQVGTS